MEPFFESYDPNRVLLPEELDRLLELGWFRMHQQIFTCSHVNLGGIFPVRWLRFDINKILERSSHRKLRKRNAKFNFTIKDFEPNNIIIEHRLLHALYRSRINFDGANSIEECLLGIDFDGLNIFQTKCISIYEETRLIACGYFDIGANSAASILHFFDSAFKKNSLGKYLMLLTIDYLKENGYRWYYPGYIVDGLSKMDYKLFVGKEVEYFDLEKNVWIALEQNRIHQLTQN